MIESDRLVTAETDEAEISQDWTVRPKTFAEYRGQPDVSAQMSIFIDAAKGRKEPLDHTLIFGPPGVFQAIEATSAPYVAPVLCGQRRYPPQPA